ncbi:MAG: tetratricopeptide repeat protein, partial [Spirochaetaceae bacterium]|nr:tetratricopeptide repeat protein [Spirochaetaceae bacterium]
AVNAAAFASLAGRWEDAATFYAYSPVNAELLLKSARCWLAAGKPGKAREQLDRIDATSANSPGIASQKNLALAWTCIFDGAEEKAFVLLQGLVGKGNGSSGGTKSAESSKTSQEGAEALFLLWVIANSADFSSFKVPTKGFDAKSLETWLAEEYPESTELSLIKRQLALLPGNLLLEGFYGSGKNVPVAEKSLATAKASGEAALDRQNGPVQLQVGYFSRKENAQAVFSSLQKKGFQVTIEEQKSSDGQLRWAVIVSSEGDWTKTQAKLKDLGYESYLLP